MKYDFANKVRENIKEIEKSTESKKIDFTKEDLDMMKELLTLVNDCHYPEIDGLKLSNEEIIICDGVAIISFINSISERFTMELSPRELVLLNENEEFLIRIKVPFGNLEKRKYEISFPIENDFVNIQEDHECNLLCQFYSNVKDVKKENGLPKDLIPDYKDTIKHNLDKYNNHCYEGKTFTSSYTVKDHMGLDKMRKYALDFSYFCCTKIGDLSAKTR